METRARSRRELGLESDVEGAEEHTGMGTFGNMVSHPKYDGKRKEMRGRAGWEREGVGKSTELGVPGYTHANTLTESFLWNLTHFRGMIIPCISVLVRLLAQGSSAL